MIQENNGKRNYIFIYLAIAIVLGIWIGRYLSPKDIKTNDENHLSKLSSVFQLINEHYVDSVNYSDLIDDVLSSVMMNLDPHSVYIPLEELQAVNDQIMGSFEGIGVQFRIEKDTVLVVQTIANGPSEKIGIRAGDRIVEVEGKNIAGISIENNDVMKLLKGEKGTKVSLGIKRKNVDGLLTFTVVRDVIPTFSIDYYGMINSNVGYIKLSSFNFDSDKEFSNALKNLKSKGMKSLIFDLRGNGGGSLNASVRILDQFFGENVLLVYTEGLRRNKNKYFSTKRGLFKEGEIIVLIDEFSASASEIVAGAIQDNKRGIVIGRSSFGKGLVQEQIDLKDGSAIRLTTARYYTPSGRSIQREYKRGTESYYNEFLDRISNDTNLTENENDTLTNTSSEKNLLSAGGIIPDILVEHNKMLINNKVLNIYFSQLFSFAFEYVDKNRNFLTQKYKNSDGFVENFNVTSEIWSEYVKYVMNNTKSSLNISERLKSEEKNFIEAHLKAMIGRNLFGSEAFYPSIRSVDEALRIAIQKLD